MDKYLGAIKTKAQAMELARKLDNIGTPSAVDAAKLLKRNWRAIASRPKIASELVALSNRTPGKTELELIVEDESAEICGMGPLSVGKMGGEEYHIICDSCEESIIGTLPEKDLRLFVLQHRDCWKCRWNDD